MRSFPRTRSLARLGALCLFAVAATCRADALTDIVVKAFRAQLPTQTITAKDANELEIKSKDGQVRTAYLDNLRKTCDAQPAECDGTITQFAQSMSSVMAAGAAPTVFVREKLYPVLRQNGYAAQASRLSDKPGNALPLRAFTTDAEMLFVIDGEKTLQYVTVDTMTKADLAPDTLMALGTANASRLPPIEPQPMPGIDGLFALVYGDSLGTARMFDKALWDRIEARAGGPVAAVAATRDWILYTRLDHAGHVAELRTLARRIAAKEAYAVSAVVVQRQGDGWTPVPAN